MVAKLAAWWNALPHGVQATLVLFGTTSAGVLLPELYAWTQGKNICTTAFWPCIGHYLTEALRTSLGAVLGLYIKSSLYKPKQP